jgi:hypothetical protein
VNEFERKRELVLEKIRNVASRLENHFESCKLASSNNTIEE